VFRRCSGELKTFALRRGKFIQENQKKIKKIENQTEFYERCDKNTVMCFWFTVWWSD